MSSGSSQEIGTLIVVLLKARNLPNKRHIGKQDPYCLLEFNGRKVRSKVIKRGGQHPEWDEEIRFTLYEAEPDVPVATLSDGSLPPVPPKKPSKDKLSVQGGKYMKMACYAQDVKEPELIGETQVDLTEVLTKGETDEWFTLTNKERYSGEVYLELTFWSNEPAPVQKPPVKAKAKKQYGGPGSFTAHSDARGSSESLNGGPSRWSPGGVRALSTTPSSTWRQSSTDVDIRSEALPPSLRSSSSITQIGLYRPNYETTSTHSSSQSSLSFQSSNSSVNALTDELGQMNLGLRRRLSLPQITHSELLQRSASSSSSSYLQANSPGYGHSSYPSYSDDGSTYNYDGAESQVGSAYPVQQQSSGPSLYQPPYEPVTRASSVYSTHPQSARGPRHSLPSSSSGFVPIATPSPSSFAVPAQQTVPYQAPVSATPAPPMYGRASVPPPTALPSALPMYAPLPGPSPAPPTFRPPTTAPTPASYPPPLSHTPAPSSSFSTTYQYQNVPGNRLSQAMSYQSIPQSQSSYSYHSYPTSSSISSNSAHQYSQPPTPPSAAGGNASAQYNSAFQPLPPPSFAPPQSQVRPPPPPPPPLGSIPAPPPVVHSQQHSLPQPPPGPPGSAQSYSASIERGVSQLSSSPSHISVNIPPPPPLNPSPSQSQTSRPLPELPPAGSSPVKRQGTMSMALSHAMTAGPPSIQPSVSYSSYNQIPPPPPITNPSAISPVHHSPQPPAPPPIPQTRQLSYPQPIPSQALPGPPLHQPLQRTPSAQALYHSAIARQTSLGNNLPPPPPSASGHWQPQSAYEALQQLPGPSNYPPPPMNHSANRNMSQPPPVGHPGALPMPPRLPPSQPNQQYPVANGWQ
ncbi:hypothetical protein BC835DRAFT_1411823 [Cytidiella melzeri]|nr:hypothetical protein BC835DRAFT_1411823 [Cytidiella melzeri]